MSDREETDSDAPEEFTAEQGVQQDEEIRKVQNESKARVIREGKERRRLWAEKKTPRPSKKGEIVEDLAEPPRNDDKVSKLGTLPSNVVQLLVDREKQVFSSDLGDEKPAIKPKQKRKKTKSSSGIETVLLSERTPSHCLQNSLEFLKKRKMNVARSSTVLNNPNQAFRLLSSSGITAPFLHSNEGVARKAF